MLHLPKRETKLLVAVHGWSGALLGLLLYAVIATGTAAVLAHEVETWSAGTTETRSALSRPVDAVVRRLAAATPARDHEGVELFDTTAGELGVFFHHHETRDGVPTDVGTYYEVATDGQVTRRLEGTGEEVFGPDNDTALGRFLVDTHVRLHVPDPWGLILTGIVGLAMLVAAVSGLLIHRHLLKDAFTLRRQAHPVLAARDRHSVAGTWSLPFAFVLAFTGSFFSFAGSVGLPTVAAVAFGGDQMRMFETLIGVEPAADPRPKTGADLDQVLLDARTRAGGAVELLAIANYGRADASVTTSHMPRPGALDPVTLVFDGATGAFRREKPSLGTEPSAGGLLFTLMSSLHFGNFAGLVSKALWVGLGFATCFVTITGLRLWLRRREHLGALARAVSVVAWGLPLALAAAGWGALIAMPAGEAVAWTSRAFLLAAAAAIGAGLIVRDERRLSTSLRIAAGAAMLLLPPIRRLSGGPGWGDALGAGQPVIMGLDLALLLAGAAIVAPVVALRPRQAAKPAMLAAAE